MTLSMISFVEVSYMRCGLKCLSGLAAVVFYECNYLGNHT